MDDFLLDNPLLQGMDQTKLQFIMNFALKDKPKTLTDAMPFLMANMSSAKKQNISFSNAEIHLIADILCKDLPSEEQLKIKRIMSMLGK